MENQLQDWKIEMNKTLELKLITYQKIQLHLSEESCRNNFIEGWGLPIFQLLSIDKFIEIFTLIMLEEKVVFVC